jgi:hypothetical protein
MDMITAFSTDNHPTDPVNTTTNTTAEEAVPAANQHTILAAEFTIGTITLPTASITTTADSEEQNSTTNTFLREPQPNTTGYPTLSFSTSQDSVNECVPPTPAVTELHAQEEVSIEVYTPSKNKPHHQKVDEDTWRTYQSLCGQVQSESDSTRVSENKKTCEEETQQRCYQKFNFAKPIRDERSDNHLGDDCSDPDDATIQGNTDASKCSLRKFDFNPRDGCSDIGGEDLPNSESETMTLDHHGSLVPMKDDDVETMMSEVDSQATTSIGDDCP